MIEMLMRLFFRSQSLSKILALGFLFFAALGSASAATKVQQITTPGGLKAWLVQDASVPLISLSFAFTGGSSQDAQGKDGATQFMASLLDEGAGSYDSRSFQEKLQALAISIHFNVDRDFLSGELKTLSANRDTAFELLRLSLNEPRFDADAVERIRSQIYALQRNETNDVERQAAYAFSAAAFPNHPYSHRTLGTEDTLKAVARDDIVAQHKKLLARDNLKITVVGDINEAEIGKALDSIFGGLPANAQLAPVAEVTLQTQGKPILVDSKGPQSQIQFGAPGPKRKDPDFMPSYLLNHMLGGSTFSSRLYKEVREKRGLTYGVYTDIVTLDHAGAFVGTLSVRNDTAGEALKLVRQETDRFMREGPGEQELAETKSYLIGSYPLRFDTTSKIASMLLSLQLDGFEPSYLEEREKLINAVTVNDIKTAAQKLLKGPFLVVVAGQPKGIETN